MHDAACEGVQGNRYRPRARLWLPACALWRSSTGPCVHCRRYTGHFRSYAVGSAGPEAQARAVRLTPLGYPVSLRPPCIIRYPSRDTLCLHLPCPRRGTPSDRNKTGQSEPPVPPVLQPVMSSRHALLECPLGITSYTEAATGCFELAHSFAVRAAMGVYPLIRSHPQSLQNPLNRPAASSVYLTVCWMFLCPR